jgi:hypothetical protein
MMMRHLPGLAFLIFGATTAQGMDLTAIKTITDVSNLGSHVHFRKEAPFGGDTFDLPISDWGLDQTVAEEVRKDLGNRFAVKAALGGTGDPVDASDVPDIASSIARGVRDPSTDAYLVILQLSQDNYPWAPIEGLEVFRINGIITSATQIYGFYEVALIDAHTFKAITWQKMQRPEAGVLGHAPQNIWADSAEDLTPEQKNILRASMTRMVILTLDETLRAMDLGS